MHITKFKVLKMCDNKLECAKWLRVLNYAKRVKAMHERGAKVLKCASMCLDTSKCAESCNTCELNTFITLNTWFKRAKRVKVLRCSQLVMSD